MRTKAINHRRNRRKQRMEAAEWYRSLMHEDIKRLTIPVSLKPYVRVPGMITGAAHIIHDDGRRRYLCVPEIV